MSRLTPFGVGGRPRKSRPLVEQTPRICVYDLAASPFTCPRPREELTVVINGRPEVLELVREPRFPGGDGQRFFLCSGCSRKVQHLYLLGNGERPACRRCSGGLTYASQHTRRRGLNRARNLRLKLGAAPGLLAPIPSKPPRWRRDFWVKAVAELAVAEGKIAGMLHAMVPRVRRRLKHGHSDRGT